MILDRKEKQPAEIKDYPISYEDWLAEAGDTLEDASAAVECLTGDDASLVVYSITLSPTAVAVWLSGGADGQKYKVTVTVNTAAGRRDESEFIMKVKDY